MGPPRGKLRHLRRPRAADETGAIALSPEASGLRVGVVGCGAAAVVNHLPALRRLGVRPQLAIDADLRRASAVAEKFGIARASADLDDAPASVDCAIVATPPDSHDAIACSLLSNGIHVLVEKPLATTPEKARRIMAAAGESGALVQVGLMRRYWHSTRWLSGFLASGARHSVEHFAFHEGSAFSWPAESDYYIRREPPGGGNLLDMGSHVLDLALSWFGDVARVSYFDDNYGGGVEAECEIYLRMESGVTGFMELSRTRELGNGLYVYGRDWLIEMPNTYVNELRALPASILKEEFGGLRGDRLPPQTLADLYVFQLADFLSNVAEGATSAVDGDIGVAVSDVIATCYAGRRPLPLRWIASDPGVLER